jgi:hypothetical protein
MNIQIIVKDKLKDVRRMKVKVTMKENGNLKVNSKLQGYGRMPEKGITAWEVKG